VHRARGTRRDAVLAERADKLSHEQRRPARRAEAGVHELLIRRHAQPFAHELGDGRPGQGGEAHDFGRGVGSHRGEEVEFRP
jgi:hypothetical protein